MAFLFEVAAVFVALLIFYGLFKFFKNAMHLLFNSIGAFIILALLNAIFGLNLAINLFSILVVALAGFPGLVLVILLHTLGLAF
ncbi:MAG: pro-sigmaK processing inhibitor BofA family protein [Candidatus Bilamarchaeum sp.]|jgi:hypothetical protein